MSVSLCHIVIVNCIKTAFLPTMKLSVSQLIVYHGSILESRDWGIGLVDPFSIFFASRYYRQVLQATILLQTRRLYGGGV